MHDESCHFWSGGIDLERFRELSADEQDRCLDCLMERWRAKKNSNYVFDFGSLQFAVRPVVNVVEE